MSSQRSTATPRHFSKQFKADAVQLVVCGTTPKQVAERLDIDAHLLRKWVRQAAPATFTSSTESISSKPTNSVPDVAALLEANRTLSAALAAREQDVAILKKAISILNPKATT